VTNKYKCVVCLPFPHAPHPVTGAIEQWSVCISPKTKALKAIDVDAVVIPKRIFPSLGIVNVRFFVPLKWNRPALDGVEIVFDGMDEDSVCVPKFSAMRMVASACEGQGGNLC
jgi:hypothetical protein